MEIADKSDAQRRAVAPAARGIPERTTVLVVGGGPAGSMAAASLAREGIDVTLLEKEAQPRYHIGESLLLSAIPFLEFVGVGEKVRRHGFIRKPGGIFKLKQGEPSGYLDFTRHRFRHSYQVVRSEFDQLLFEHARDVGARAFDRCRVAEIEFADGRPVAATWQSDDREHGSIGFDYLVDASGLNGLMATRYLKNRVLQQNLQNIALGQYWRNTRRVDGERAGAIHIESLADGSGWSWVIPLHDGSDSVGVVIDRDTFQRLKQEHGTNEAVFQRQLRLSPDASALLEDGHLVSETRAWQDYSYVATEFSGPGFCLAGDAAGFIDPFFSTGVHLALLGGLSSAAAICSVVRGQADEAAAFTYHDQATRRAYMRFLLAVSGLYVQIRNQKQVVLPWVNQRGFQLAMDVLLPIVGGLMDTNLREVPRTSIDRAMRYLSETVLEMHGFESNSNVSKLISRNLVRHEIGEIDPHEAIDGWYIHMKHGELGLRRVGRVTSALRAVRKKFESLGFVTAAWMDKARA
jgi:flavin-dependent dehydrogenase